MEKDEYPLSFVLGQNIFLLVYFGIGFAGMLPLKVYNLPVISILYVLFLILTLTLLRKHICTNCYYYGKLCNTGWGKIATVFKKNSGNYKFGLKLASVTWALATLIPLGIILVLVLTVNSLFELVLFLLFVILTPINFAIHKNACRMCKMKFTCPASMAR